MTDEAAGEVHRKWRTLPLPISRDEWVEESEVEPVPGSLNDADARLAQSQTSFYGFDPRG